MPKTEWHNVWYAVLDYADATKFERGVAMVRPHHNCDAMDDAAAAHDEMLAQFLAAVEDLDEKHTALLEAAAECDRLIVDDGMPRGPEREF